MPCLGTTAYGQRRQSRAKKTATGASQTHRQVFCAKFRSGPRTVSSASGAFDGNRLSMRCIEDPARGPTRLIPRRSRNESRGRPRTSTPAFFPNFNLLCWPHPGLLLVAQVLRGARSKSDLISAIVQRELQPRRAPLAAPRLLQEPSVSLAFHPHVISGPT